MPIARAFTPFGLVLLLVAAVVGCKKPVAPDGPLGPRDLVVDDVPRKKDDSPPPLPDPDVLGRARFSLDSAALDEDAKVALRRNAELLKRHSAVHVEIQGHCDERGTTDHNIALGDRRASAVKKFLSAQGIAGSRMTTVSYGEEKPASFGHDEGAWATNRRVELRVTSGGDDTIAGSVP